MSATINEIQYPCGVAAVRKDDSLRIYEVDVAGGVREVQYEGKWTGGTSSNIIATGKIGTPLAAINNEFKTIRVYCLGADNFMKEAAYDSGKGWCDGDLSSNYYRVAPYSGISAVFFHKTLIRVYGQVPNNTIQEWCWDDGKWNVGTNFGAALAGTKIAATTWSDSIRVYYQTSKFDIVEKAWDGKGWYDGGLHFHSMVPRASLGVTSWGEGNDFGIRLYYSTPDNTIKEKAWDGSGNWYDGGFSQASVPGSRVCALPLPVLRVYLQKGVEGTAITEFAWNNRWVVGKEALPPA